ncbi:TPA: site-specific integrase [Candidatus Poribacteria bacterium]|nr:site-specific integrase [Candidatus Poribacteria bacterium]
MRYNKFPFGIFIRQRKNSNVKYIYYYFYKNGKRLIKSTGISFESQKEKGASIKRAIEQLQQLFKEDSLHISDTITLTSWVENEMHFWEYDQSRYVRSKLLRSPIDKPSITERYVLDGRKIWENHIKPFHGKLPISKISSQDCENLLFDWLQDGSSHKTVNNRRSIYSTMMKEAVRLGVIKQNPWQNVPQLAINSKKFGGFSFDEVERILNAPVETKDRVYYLATKLAFLTGLRIGEICGLQTDDIRTKTIKKKDRLTTMYYINVTGQYSTKLKKRTIPKDKDARAIPISESLYNELADFIKQQGYLFSFHPGKETPITANRLREWLYKRMEKVGIYDYKERNLTFHSTRRFFNTLLRRRVSEDVLRKMTGHGSEEMTEHYTDYLPEDLEIITQTQDLLA